MNAKMPISAGARRLRDFKAEFAASASPGHKTAELDRFSRELIRKGADVAFLKGIVLEHQEYHRIYFQVSLAGFDDAAAQFAFIEENFDLLQDWWHVDQLTQFLRKVEFAFALRKAEAYVLDPRPYVRRWGYVLFIPYLLKEAGAAEMLFPLFRDDDEYTVQMAEAWLISCLAMQKPEKTFAFLRDTSLRYSITGKAIQKICDSFRVTEEWKSRFRGLRASCRGIR